MNTTQFQVLEIDKEKGMVSMAYGAIKFYCSVTLRKEDGAPMITKPTSIYIEKPDFYEMIQLIRSAWRASK